LISSWWAVVGGLAEAVQVYAGLTLVNKVGAGLFVGFTVNAARIPSLLIDHFGRLRMQPHPSFFRTPTGMSGALAAYVFLQ
jgi:bacterial/archaeal transporter family-2 protein